MINFLSVYHPATILKRQFNFIRVDWPGLRAKKKPALRASSSLPLFELVPRAAIAGNHRH